MLTAIDTSVLLDLLLDDKLYAERSSKALARAREEGALVVSEIVIAELAPVLDPSDISQFIQSLALTFVPTTLESAVLAGSAFSAYLKRGGKRKRVVADFIIGAHAKLQADRLLARDRGFYRDYFKGLSVLEP